MMPTKTVKTYLIIALIVSGALLPLIRYTWRMSMYSTYSLSYDLLWLALTLICAGALWMVVACGTILVFRTVKGRSS